MIMKKTVSCHTCTWYAFDEEYDAYVCDMNLDQDEMERFITNTVQDCPYYRLNDEYLTVRKQN
ncbi:MAG: hypothetical protein HFE90_10045 [Firmicutes bacterium]|nr:hypothetical protein [Bacillota bacterium]